MIKLTLKNSGCLRVMIAEQGKNLKEFSKQSGISQTYLTQILKGDRSPSPTVGYKIAKSLGVEIGDIFLIISFTKNNPNSHTKQGG